VTAGGVATDCDTCHADIQYGVTCYAVPTGEQDHEKPVIRIECAECHGKEDRRGAKLKIRDFTDGVSTGWGGATPGVQAGDSCLPSRGSALLLDVRLNDR
jgi:hypothetical protein